MKHLATVVSAAALACVITTAARAVDVCAYSVSSRFGTGCPFRLGASVCLSAAANVGRCDAAVDCVARLRTAFCRARLVPQSGPQPQCPAGSLRLVGFSCFAPHPPAPTRTATPAPTPGTVPLPFLAQRLFRADDGTSYQVISVEGGSTADVRVTTLAGSIAGVGVCQMTSGPVPGELVSGVAGALPPAVSLHPYDLIHRTALFTPNAATIAFTPDFGGRLVIGTGAGAAAVCSSVFDCIGQQNVLPLVGLDSATGGVPAACIANDLAAACDGTNVRDAFAFGVPSQGAPPVCTDGSAVTVNTTLCAAPPVDGFTLHSGEFIVMVHGQPTFGFSTGIAGFGISSQATAVCPGGGVINAVAATNSTP
jgi:hypothetical protein